MKGDSTVKLRLRIISVIAALCFLGSVACFSAVAAEMLAEPSGDEEPIYTDPVEPVTPEPVDPGPVTPEPVEPEPYVPEYTESTYTEDPTTYEDPTDYEDPTISYDPNEPDYNSAYESLISEGNFPQPNEYVAPVSSTYVDNTQQYNQYIENQYNAQYDDNYIYVPEYEEPTTSLVATASKIIDTDELTGDDWDSIILDLSNGNLDAGGTQTFSFIKDNDAEGDTDMMWLVYLGAGLIVAAVLLVIFVIVSTIKADSASKEVYYV